MAERPITRRRVPEKKPTPPRLFTSTPANICRSLERLARWSLKADVSPGQVNQVRAAAAVLRLRLEMERLILDRERFEREGDIEVMLERLERLETDAHIIVR